MDKLKLFVSILVLIISAIMLTIGAFFIEQNIGMLVLIFFGAMGLVAGFIFIAKTMEEEW